MAHAEQELILALNAGSSSLKISLFERQSSGSTGSDQHANPVKLLLNSSFDNLSSPPSTFSFSFVEKTQSDTPVHKKDADNVTDHASAFSRFLAELDKTERINQKQICYVCHRVVHGGDYKEPIIVSKEAYHHIEALTDLAPLHNGAALSVIHAVLERLPGAKSVAYFDTTFHKSIPPHISAYAIDQNVAMQRGIRKYGFHGLSYAYILRAVASFLHKPESQCSLIVMHLGSGASVCSIKNGRSLDTSMGLTPLHGLPGATRSGAIDPAAIFHYTNNAGRISHDKKHAVDVTVTEAEEILNKKAGWKAITGTTDFGEIIKGMSHDPSKKLAFDLFLDRVLTYLGSYYLKLNGEVDALVFAGGIGEKSAELRAAIVHAMRCLGFMLDENMNNGAGDRELDGVVDIGARGDGKGERVLVCWTDEQEEMARECASEPNFWEG